MKQYFKLSLVLLVFSFYFGLVSIASAAETKQVTIVNPIRGNDFWTHPFSVLETSKKQYELISRNNLSSTWLVRYDGLKNAEIVAFLKQLNTKQEVGIFMEVTPSLTSDAGVKYNQSPSWHFAKSVLLTGYSPDDRKKLIDAVFNRYRQVFEKYPKSVGAWWIDADSLNYMREKYKVEINMDVADQYSTDGYQVWGQYFSLPFYPSKSNALMPAQSVDRKIGLVTIQWAIRDPFNAYGNGVGDSTYSVQANDYVLHKLGINYFEKLLNIFPQITVGMENDFSWSDYGREYQRQIELLSRKQGNGVLQVKTMMEYASYYKQKNPDVSPSVLIAVDDPLGGEGKVVWYQTPKYRVGWFYNHTGSVIRDLREYNDSADEPCLKSSCSNLNLAVTTSKPIDEVTFGNKWQIDVGKITDINVSQSGNQVEINYNNQAGTKRSIRFFPNDIEVNGKIKTISGAIIDLNTEFEKLKTQAGPVGNEKIFLRENWSKLFINILKFIILTFFFFYLPGVMIVRNHLLSIPVGWALFSLLAFALGYLKFDYLIWGLPVISFLVMLKTGFVGIKVQRPNFKDVPLLIILLAGSYTWLMTNIKSGILYSFGLGFWGPNGHDAIWHLSLISELERNFPPQNPVFAGVGLNNYHYFFDLLIARSSLLFSIDNLDLIFRLFPFVFAILSGLIMYAVVLKICKRIFNYSDGSSRIGAISATFLLYFGGSFGWIISYFRDGSIGGESMFWAQQGISTLLNPPYAISLILFLTGFYVFVDYIEKFPRVGLVQIISLAFWKRNLYVLITLGVVWGTLVEFKAYGGVLVLVSIAILFLVELVRMNFRLLPIILICGLVSALVFLPNNNGSNSLFEYRPLWLVQTMIQFEDRLSWQRLNLAIESGVIYKVILGNLIAVAIFVLGNLGTRIIGLFGIRQFKGLLIIDLMALLGLVLSLLFVQIGNSWNIVQFFYYTIFVLNIFAGINMAFFWQKMGSRFVVVSIMLILFTLPTSLDTVYHQYIPSRPPARLPVGEIEALNFLKIQPPGVVMTLPFDETFRSKAAEPLPLWAYTSTGYVSAFSGHPTFMEDTINLDILGVDYKGRLNLQRDLRIRERTKDILKQNNIAYLYIIKSGNFEADEGKMGIRKIFENEDAVIYKVI